MTFKIGDLVILKKPLEIPLYLYIWKDNNDGTYDLNIVPPRIKPLIDTICPTCGQTDPKKVTENLYYFGYGYSGICGDELTLFEK
jgi:hypothetical protein